MITFSNLENKGNLGNQLFQIASTIGLAKKNNQTFVFKDWKYQNYFENNLPVLDKENYNFEPIEEREYNFHEWQIEPNRNYDLEGWLQTEKYFDKELTKYYFQFSDDLIKKVKEKYKSTFEKEVILISIRRGDFVNHPDYFQTPIKYYLNSLIKFFPDWESQNLIVLSDDINYCKFHFSFLKNAFFGDGLSAIEQLCLGSLCNHFIIGNSTFSWWSAYLGEKEGSCIIRPNKNFRGQLSLKLNDVDYFPERWIQYNHLNEKMTMNNTSLNIVADDYKNRLNTYLNYYFNFCSETSKDKQTKLYKYSFYKPYYLPPLLLYMAYLKMVESNSKLISINPIHIYKVSHYLNYAEFNEQQDFGMFSKIFSTSKLKLKIKKGVGLENNSAFDVNDSLTNEIQMQCSFGILAKLGGFRFTLLKILKSTKILIKKNIKKILLIKK